MALFGLLAIFVGFRLFGNVGMNKSPIAYGSTLWYAFSTESRSTAFVKICLWLIMFSAFLNVAGVGMLVKRFVVPTPVCYLTRLLAISLVVSLGLPLIFGSVLIYPVALVLALCFLAEGWLIVQNREQIFCYAFILATKKTLVTTYTLHDWLLALIGIVVVSWSDLIIFAL
jgi:hypothetical protein